MIDRPHHRLALRILAAAERPVASRFPFAAIPMRDHGIPLSVSRSRQ